MKKFIILIALMVIVILGVNSAYSLPKAQDGENAITYIEIHDTFGPIFTWGSRGEPTPTAPPPDPTKPAPTPEITPTVVVEPTPTAPPPDPTAPPPDPTIEPTLPPPDPTATPVVEPTPTDVPSGPSEPYPEAPACPDHNNRQWHGLWDYERGCHYDHHHGDNPHELDDVLGGNIYALMGGEVSYPWQTVSADGYNENDAKHAGYIWYVRENIPCASANPCVTNFRAIVHQHTMHDASVRFHSYTMEGTTSDNGYFLLGGHMDFGDLHAPEGTIVANVEGNHCGNPDAPGNHKQHAVEGGSRAPSNIWYGRSRINSDPNVDRSCGFAVLGTSAQDPWIWTTQEAPFMGNFVCFGNPRCRNNATTYRPHLFGINLDIDGFDFLYENGVTNFDGWADRYGVPYPDRNACSSPSIDCAPFIVRGLQHFNYGTNPSHTANAYRDYDIYFDNRPAGWAQPVN